MFTLGMENGDLKIDERGQPTEIRGTEKLYQDIAEALNSHYDANKQFGGRLANMDVTDEKDAESEVYKILNRLMNLQDGASLDEKIKSYKKLLEHNIELANKAMEEATKVNDRDTEDVLVGLSKNRSKSLYFVKSLLGGDCKDEVTASTEITAGYDKLKFKEIKERPDFFKQLKENCGITYSNFKTVNRGLRLAIKVIEEKYPEASIRFFLKKGSDGYIRVELNDNVYIIGYTIYDSGKIKVWTRELKRNIPVNNFDFTMLDLLSHKKGATKLPPAIMPIWISL